MASMDSDPHWKRNTLLIGGALGALTGVGAAYLLIRRVERQGGKVQLSPGKGVRLGMTVLGLMRQVGKLGERES